MEIIEKKKLEEKIIEKIDIERYKEIYIYIDIIYMLLFKTSDCQGLVVGIRVFVVVGWTYTG